MEGKVSTADQRQAVAAKKPTKAEIEKKRHEEIKAIRVELVKRAIAHRKERLTKDRAIAKAKKEAMINGDLYAEAEQKLIVAIRIRGINNVSPKIRKTLKLLKLRQINNAVFIRANASTLKMLKIVEPYITYGYPSLKTVSDLIYARGALKMKGDRQKITSNELVKKVFDKRADIVCVEDIVHEIFTVGKNFKLVNSALAPFKLNNQKGKLARKNKKIHFILGGAFGNRETMINKLLRTMI
ncbi:60S ribosomal protein L7, putative [Entamoeba invadens IP1]|uniref:60S ribosomal protein L7, putative n=1 Tax=Entamoeba invadens TaxID=33085 RepID=S0AYS9_ENTIV|nr:60S ribosomal protein L7, putative [Entamoeba invadens IP1]ELP93086.1 60S ribosomal protein L7, putative [Entamoeba invadens IP1]BAN40443.1 60S ribosomal protein L7, putative [Entamoeba invadens]BAN41673.1 60S ribosomal protein L7, putative [Entamoeba invadens]BAN42378.1 60S ribosomal protein L7, putative [Entamoeba invadens]|eukprot:XP_004259857.1 60S ribosomal protein L7, putative [Entamoeba invadens IP1]